MIPGVVVPGIALLRAGVSLVPVVLPRTRVRVANGPAGVLLVSLLLAIPALGVALLAVLGPVIPLCLEGLALAPALGVPVALITLLWVRASLVSLLLVAGGG